MNLLPCKHDAHATQQIEPTKELLINLDGLHPDVLRTHGIEPADYHSKLVFRSAVESIRGSYIASSLPQRQGFVATTLDALRQRRLIEDYQSQAARRRFDFQVMVSSSPRVMVALEVKGGEGNSINISDRPLWADEFIVWCHLDGAIVNQPAHGAAAIIFNRISREMVRAGKRVDAVIFKDARCNSPLRPCPKYPDGSTPAMLGVAPDIFLMPKAIPTFDDPAPPAHDLTTVSLPVRILQAHGVLQADFENHVWQVTISLSRDDRGRLLRETSVFHKGRLVGSGRSAN